MIRVRLAGIWSESEVLAASETDATAKRRRLSSVFGLRGRLPSLEMANVIQYHRHIHVLPVF